MGSLSGDAERERFDALTRAWLAAQSSANTRAAYGTDVAAFGRWCAQTAAIPLQVTTADVIAFQQARVSAGDSPSTLRRRSSSLSSFFRYAMDEDLVSCNPVAGSARPKVDAGDPSPTALMSTDLVERSLSWAQRADSRLHALMALIVFDGLKMGEALAADVDDLSGRAPRVRLALQRSRPASMASASIVLHERSVNAVRHLARRRRGEPLFVSASPSAGAAPRRLTRFGADHLIRQIPVPALEPAITAGALRRYHITAAHLAGDDLDEIAVRTGIDDARTIRRYLAVRSHVSPNTAAGPGSDRRSDHKEV